MQDSFAKASDYCIYCLEQFQDRVEIRHVTEEVMIAVEWEEFQQDGFYLNIGFLEWVSWRLRQSWQS